MEVVGSEVEVLWVFEEDVECLVLRCCLCRDLV